MRVIGGRFLRVFGPLFSLLIGLLFPSATICSAQTTAQPAILSEIESAFAGTRTVTTVELTGTAHWHAGSLEDSGSATLTA